MVINLWTATEDIFHNGEVIPYEFSARDWLKAIISNQSANGWTLQQIRDRIKMLDKIDLAEESIEFDDNERKFILQKINEAGFTIPSANIVKLAEILEHGDSATPA